MKRAITYLRFLLAMLAVSSNSFAQNLDPTKPISDQFDKNVKSEITQAKNLNVATSANELTVVDNKGLDVTKSKTVKKQAKVKARKIASIADLSGTYVMNYASLSTAVDDGGGSVTIVPIEGTDSVTLQNFWYDVVNAKAKVDLATKTITIPSQYAYDHITYGAMDLAVCISDGTPDRTGSLVGTINDDGTISINTWWGIYVNNGTYANRFIGVYNGATLEKANATMSQKTFSGTVSTYGVIATQTGTNVLSVKNFANYGQTIEIDLNSNKTATLAPQAIRKATASNKANYMLISVTYDSTGYIQTYSYPITSDKATDNRTITWHAWSGLSKGNSSYTLGTFVDGKITLNSDIIYPTKSTTSLDGKGTASDPYLIKSLDDLIYMSDQVKSLPSSKTLAYKGVYFRLENDIDMKHYKFTPIGNSASQRFAGIFDGNGKTISNLYVNKYNAYTSDNYVGLFGMCDTACVIKNLNIESATINSNSYFVGAFAGLTYGAIENCHLYNSTIYNGGDCTGGLAGVCVNIKNCSASNSTVTGIYGFTGGLVGEIQFGNAVNNSATNMTVNVYCPYDNYPGGGLYASLYKSTANQNYFSGIVTSASLKASGQAIGGLVGRSYNGTISNSFFVGTVQGYDKKTIAGGIIGDCYSATITNSYSSGHISCADSKYCGGITGYLRKTTVDGITVQPTVQNCFTAASIEAETESYDNVNECREVFGVIDTASTPNISNVYFDAQMSDFTSTQFRAKQSELTAASGPTGFDASNWTFTEGQYPRVKGLENTETAKYASSVILFGNGNLNKVNQNAKINALGETKYYLNNNSALGTEGHYCSIAGDSIILKNEFGNDTLYVSNNNYSYYQVLKVAPVPFEGNGTTENPYLIKTKNDLVTLSQITTNKGQLFNGDTFKMTNDIDLEYTTDFVGICNNSENTDNQFMGTFDGDGHTVHNMYLNGMVWTTEPDAEGLNGTPNTTSSKSYQGFIGRLYVSGAVKNVSIGADAKLSFWSHSGAIVGYNYGKVENCKNYAKIVGYSRNIGGIVGDGLTGSTISGCYNAGDVYCGYAEAGGIIGDTYGKVANCENVGNVYVDVVSTYQSGKSTLCNAGGIVGVAHNTIIKNCLNAGSAYALTSNAGGLFGKLDGCTVTNCINYGLQTSPSKSTIGGVSGIEGNANTLSNVYYDAQITPYGAVANKSCDGVIEAETAELISGKTLDSYADSVWIFKAGQYPMLKNLAAEDYAEKASQVIFKVATGETVKDLISPATTIAKEGLTWKLAQGTNFKYVNDTITAPSETVAVLTDTLVATYGGYVKNIILKRGSVPLDGDGTAENPYLIKSADDWNNLADFINATETGFNEEYLQVANDFSFSDKTFKPLFKVSALGGTLDGNGKTISDITYTATASYDAPIGSVNENGVIKNLTLEGNVTAGYTYCSGIVGKLYGTIDGVINKVSVKSTRSYSAGVVASAYTGAKILNTINKASISSSNTYVAGVAAYAQTGVEFTNSGNEGSLVSTYVATYGYIAGVVAYSYGNTFTNCYNKADINITGNAGAVAGIISYMYGVTKGNPFIFKGCYNTGNITAKNLVAGLVATTSSTTAGASVIQMDSCYNTGNIKSNSTKATSGCPTAGLIAYYSAGSTITNSWNEGTISADFNANCSGLLGHYKQTTTAKTPIVVKKCYNKGNVIATNSLGGGIFGSQPNYTTVDSCYNTGNIEGGFNLGGISGLITGDECSVTNSYNTGNVTSSSYRTGGIVGCNYSHSKFTNVFNTGNIATTDTVGGTSVKAGELSGFSIGGIAGLTYGVLTNCYNTGSVSGASRVGGLVGTTYRYKNVASGISGTEFYNCYNAGIVSSNNASLDSIGNITGCAEANNGMAWNTDNPVKNCYYVKEFAPAQTINSIGTAISVSDLAKLDMGENWTSYDNYSYPVLDEFSDLDVVKANAAAVVLDSKDTYNNVVNAFYLGAPEDASWKSSKGSITTTDGASRIKDAHGEITLTVTAGDYSKDWKMVWNGTSGIDDFNTAKDIVKTEYYTISGIKVSVPTEKNDNIYIVVRTYSDGSTTSTKEIY